MPAIEQNDFVASLEVALHMPDSQDRYTTLRSVLDDRHPADIAEAMGLLDFPDALIVFNCLNEASAADVLDELDPELVRYLTSRASPERIAALLDRLPMDDAAEVVAEALPERTEALLADLYERAPEDAVEVRELLSYGERTAGRLMTDKYLPLSAVMNVEEAFAVIRRSDPEIETLSDLYVVEEVRRNGHVEQRLVGLVNLRGLVRADPTQRIEEVMVREPLTVTVDTDQQEVARLISKYDFLAMPVLDRDGFLAGIITVDDALDIMVEEFNEDIARMVGTEAEEMERKTPAQVAKLRLPWIMATMFIELGAGFVIHHYDQTLTRFILLASFMPIISAISGNTGLQSAAIIIRGLSTGHVQLSHWRHAVARQFATTLILGAVCALVLGIIGAAWDRHWAFGLTVFLGMFTAVNIAGIVGTVVPLLSKRAGYDPALTAGPFETAFQDVIGISIFLSLASVLLHWLR